MTEKVITLILGMILRTSSQPWWSTSALVIWYGVVGPASGSKAWHWGFIWHGNRNLSTPDLNFPIGQPVMFLTSFGRALKVVGPSQIRLDASRVLILYGTLVGKLCLNRGLEMRQSYRVVILYSYGLCLIIYLIKYLSSHVRFGYISFLYFIIQKLTMCHIYNRALWGYGGCTCKLCHALNINTCDQPSPWYMVAVQAVRD